MLESSVAVGFSPSLPLSLSLSLCVCVCVCVGWCEGVVRACCGFVPGKGKQKNGLGSFESQMDWVAPLGSKRCENDPHFARGAASHDAHSDAHQNSLTRRISLINFFCVSIHPRQPPRPPSSQRESWRGPGARPSSRCHRSCVAMIDDDDVAPPRRQLCVEVHAARNLPSLSHTLEGGRAPRLYLALVMGKSHRVRA